MQIVVYLLAIILIVFVVFALLPIILPIVLILIVVSAFFIWYAKRKLLKHLNENNMNGYASNLHDTDAQNIYDSSASGRSDDVIDVEFTQREDREGK